jgi:tetratricopeptide (TPR) repeat protein
VYASLILLWLPTVILLGYLARHLPDFLAVYAQRPFTLGQRLLTEGRVLFLYLFDAFLPHGSVRTLYDDLPISRSWLEPWTTPLAMVAWAGLVVAALRCRRQLPALSLAVGWYLVGHVMESSVIPLELAFAHRSYLPLLGMSLGAVALARELALSGAAQRLRTILSGAGIVYALLLLGCLWRSATLWGKPLEQASMWAMTQPDSSRAVIGYGNMLLRNRNLEPAYQLFEQAWFAHPEDGVLALSAFTIGCVRRGDHLPVETVAAALRNYRGPEAIVAVSTVYNMITRLEEGSCPEGRPADVLPLVEAMLANPAFSRVQPILYRANAETLDLMGDKRAALEQLEKSIAVDPQIPALQQAMLWSIQLDDTKRARAYLDTAEHSASISPTQRWLFRRDIAGSRQLIELYEALQQPSGG